MKKFISALLSAVLVFTLGVSVFAYSNGDMDGNNEVTSADARKILRAAVELDALTDQQKLCADLNLDGNITSADARTALRLAVGLDVGGSVFCTNQYEALLAGHYLAEFMVPESGMTEPIVLAVSEGATYMCVSFKDDSFSDLGITSLEMPLLFKNNDVYLVDEKDKQYCPFPFELFGMSKDELTEMAPADLFSRLEPLGKATSSAAESFNGIACTAYLFRYTNGSVKVYMNGKKLVAIRYLNEKGAVDTTYIFNRVSIAVPVEYTDIPSSFTAAEDALTMMIMMFFGDRFGG